MSHKTVAIFYHQSFWWADGWCRCCNCCWCYSCCWCKPIYSARIARAFSFSVALIMASVNVYILVFVIVVGIVLIILFVVPSSFRPHHLYTEGKIYWKKCSSHVLLSFLLNPYEKKNNRNGNGNSVCIRQTRKISITTVASGSIFIIHIFFLLFFFWLLFLSFFSHYSCEFMLF